MGTGHRAHALLSVVASVALVSAAATAQSAFDLGTPPPGFSSAKARGLHYVRGGQGPAVILLHGFPENWAEYRAIMPRLAKRFTVVAVDLPGTGQSAPATSGYDAPSLAAQIHVLSQALKLGRAYVVGHDLGGIVTYAYVRRFPEDLRGAMILDVPIPGVAGWEEAVADFWHIRFIQAPGRLAEKLVVGRQDAFIAHSLSIAKFTPAQRAYYVKAYGASQLSAAFEIYRAFPRDAQFNAAQTAPNATPLVVAVGEQSFFGPLLATFVAGFRATGLTRVEQERIPDSSHYVLADNPEAVADLIERHAPDAMTTVHDDRR